MYYFLLDEVQLLDGFVSVLNGLADKKIVMYMLLVVMPNFCLKIL